MAGSIQPLRNHLLVLDAFDNGLFKKGLNLVIAGKASGRTESIQERIRRHPLCGRQVFLIERTDSATIDYLYGKAFCVAFAPLREGFGFPVIEAFQHGVPVLASDIPVLREVGGDFCRYFNPHAPGSFTDVISPLLESEGEYGALRQKVAAYRPATWDEVSDRIADFFRKQASPSLARRLIARFAAGKSRKRLPAVTGDAGGAKFADQNLGSSVRLYLPCHDGLSVDMDDNVWTNGNVATVRLKIRGAFRRGLCLVMDFMTFNGRKKADLYANGTAIGSIDACGRASRIFSIPASCIGEDRTLSIRMDLPDAAVPDDIVHNGDKRLLSLRLLDMRLFDEDGYFACHCGETLFFAEDEGALAVQYCTEGVSHPEKAFTWTNGGKFRMRLCPLEGMPGALTLHYRTFLPEEHVAVFVNGVEIDRYVARGEESKTFDIPAKCASEDGYLELALLLPDAVSPKELKRGGDSRNLALKLFSVRFE